MAETKKLKKIDDDTLEVTTTVTKSVTLVSLQRQLAARQERKIYIEACIVELEEQIATLG